MAGIAFPFIFHTSLPPDEAARLGVASVGDFSAEHGFISVRRVGWRVEHLIYTLEGAALGDFGGTEVRASPGTIWFMPKDSSYSYRTDPQVGHWAGRWIEYDGAWARQLWKLMGLDGVLEVPGCLEAGPVVAEIFALLQAEGNAAAHQATGLLVQLLALAEKRLRGQKSSPSPAEDAVARACRHVKERLAEPLALEDLAKAARLSPYHFLRVFRAQTGFTPAAYVRALRVSRAQELLRRGDLGVKQVGAQVGFPSLQHFSNVFKRVTGLAPGAFARAHRAR